MSNDEFQSQLKVQVKFHPREKDRTYLHFAIAIANKRKKNSSKRSPTYRFVRRIVGSIYW